MNRSFLISFILILMFTGALLPGVIRAQCDPDGVWLERQAYTSSTNLLLGLGGCVRQATVITPLQVSNDTLRLINGSVIGYVLTWNGTIWVPAVPTGNDDWGTQVVQRDSSLQGNGTTGSPLGIKGYGAASVGQVPSKAAGGITWVDPGTGTTNLSYSGAGSPVTLNSSSGTDVTITQGTGISLSATGSDLTITNSDPDQSVTNEGSLTVGAGGANTSTIESNTSGSTPVTVSGSNTILVTEAGSTITLQADTSLLATVNDINAARNRDDSTFARLPGELYHTKRITSNAYRYGTTGFRTIDTVGVVSVKTKTAKTGVEIAADTSGNGTLFLSLKPPAFSNPLLTNLQPFNFYGQRFEGVNSPFSTRPNYVWGMGWNLGTNGVRLNTHEAAGGIHFETYYQNASLGAGGATGVTEFHLFTIDTTGATNRFLSSAEPWDGRRWASVLTLQTDKLNYSDRAASAVWSVDPQNNVFDFQDTTGLTFNEPRGFALTVKNGANSAFLNLIDFTDTDTLQIARQNLLGVRFGAPPIFTHSKIYPDYLSVGLEIGSTTRKHNLIVNSPNAQALELRTGITTGVYGYNANPETNVTANPGSILQSNISSVGGLWLKESGTGATGWKQALTTSNLGTGAANRIAVWSSTTVIGSDADFQWDGNKMQISGVQAGQQNAVEITNTNAGTNDQTMLRFWNDSGVTGNDGGYIGLASSGRSAPYANALFYWNAENGPVVFAMNNAEKMRVTANGLIIGSTASAANKLDVEGAAVIGATYSGTSAASANGLLVEGNVGIGNTSAQRKLHVTGEVRITDLVTDNPTQLVGADADGDLSGVTAAGGLSISGTTITMPSGTIHQTLRHNGTDWVATSEILNDDAAVGIGGSPVSGFELYVNGAQRNDGAYVTRGAGSDYTANLAAPHVRIWNTTATTGDTWYLASLNNGDLAFASSNLSGVQMLIENTTGDVGIGNSAPTQKLHVTGSARVTGAYFDSNNEAGTSGQVLSSTVTGTDWISAGAGTLTAANNGLYVSGTTVRLGTNPLIEATTIDQDANQLNTKDGRLTVSRFDFNPYVAGNIFGALEVSGTGAAPATAITPAEDYVMAVRGYNNGGGVYYANTLFFGVNSTSSNGVWMQARSESAYTTYYPLLTQPRGGNFAVGRATAPLAKATFSAIGLTGSTASGSTIHWENSEGNQKAAATFGVGTDVTDGEIAYFDATDIVRVTNRNTTTGTSSFRIAVGGETSDRVTVVAATVTPNARMGVGTTSPLSTLQSAGSLAASCITFTGALTLDERHYRVEYTGTAAITITLPTAANASQRMYVIHHRGTGGTITLSIAINKGNGTTFNTLTAGQHVFIHSDGTTWNGIKLNSL